MILSTIQFQLSTNIRGLSTVLYYIALPWGKTELQSVFTIQNNALYIGHFPCRKTGEHNNSDEMVMQATMKKDCLRCEHD